MMSLALVSAILSPFLWGAMNVIDKYIIHKKVKNAYGYTGVVGLVNILIALAIAAFLDWSTVDVHQLIFPAVAGFFLGLSAFVYIVLLEDIDISHLVGFIYFYPIIVALLSYFFIHEKLSLLGYGGMAFTIVGVIMLSVRIKYLSKTNVLYLLGAIILFEAVHEFSVKLATTALTPLQGVVINNLVVGLTLLCGLFNKNLLKHFMLELRNTPWEFLSALFALGGIGTLYFAMSTLPATIVSSIGAIQPLAVLIFERIITARIGTITKDTQLLPKLSAILFIVFGVVLLSIATTTH